MDTDDELIDNLDRPAGDRPDRPPPAPAIFVPVVPTPAPLAAEESEDEEDAPIPRKLTLSLAQAAPAPGKPLAEIVASAAHAHTRTPVAREDAASPDPRPEARIPVLERQVAALKEQLEAARFRPKKRRGGPLVAVGVLALGTGLLLGALINRAPAPLGEIVILPPRDALPTVAPSRPHPGPKDVEDAQTMLRSADEHLAKRDLDQAQRFLGLCIELGDLPACHLRLGSILALVQDRSARQHFDRYLERVPEGAQSEALRRALE